ncbi:protein kinase [Citrobacter sp. FDAARGOS_156]|uniref:protein kinase n=1 Tax=Citrobacter sp. FDAARGOS_156 TaxID=1702170 RepID=UPI00190148C7|nr:protein kinase [Citrobacter sp. FDAARGOS_156]MBJ8742352.1 protein kinase [Citrobacter sp. FDAARGOS_156]
MMKRFRRMSDSDINMIVSDLERWAMGEVGSKLTWAMLEKRFNFSRQSLQAKSEIKAAYDIAKRALSKGLVKTRGQAAKEAKELQVEIDRLKTELEAYKLKEERWLRRWQQIAFHIRQMGIQMINVDKTPQEGTMLPSHTVTAQILKPFDKEIPPSGRL